MSLQITVAKIPEEGTQLAARLDPGPLALETPDVRFAEPLVISAFCQRHDDDLLVSVEAEGRMALVCGRCLGIYHQAYREQFQLDVEIRQRLTIDIADDIRQEVVLSYPMKFLCREDCRGLCPSCGQNLNEGRCSCPSQTNAQRGACDDGPPTSAVA